MKFQVGLSYQIPSEPNLPVNRCSFHIPKRIRARLGLHQHDHRAIGQYGRTDVSRLKLGMNSDVDKLRKRDQQSKDRPHKLDFLLYRSSARLDLVRNKYNSLSSIETVRLKKHSKVRTIPEAQSKSSQLPHSSPQDFYCKGLLARPRNLKASQLNRNFGEDMFGEQITIVAKKCSTEHKHTKPEQSSWELRRSFALKRGAKKQPASRRYLHQSITSFDSRQCEPWVARFQQEEPNISRMYDKLS